MPGVQALASSPPAPLSPRIPPLVLCVARPPPVTGQAAATEMLIDALERQGWRHEIVDFAGAFRTGNAVLAVGRRALEIAALPFRLVRRTAPLREAPIYYHQLGQGTAALLRDLPLLGHAASRGWPLILHVHGGGFRAALDRAPAPVRWAVKAVVRRAARAIVLSPSLAPMFDGLLPPGRVVAIDNGVDAALAESARTFVRTHRADGPLTLLYLSNLMESKGYATVIEAARLDHARGARHRFVLAGARTGETTVDPAAESPPNLAWLGPAHGAEKLRLLAEADVFCLPTRYPVEGQPIALLEAMHFGLPLLTTRAGGIPDFVAEGENGLFVRPDDPAAILAALDRLAAEPGLRARMAEANRALAASRFTAEAHGDAMLSLFAEVASECAPP